MLRAVDDVEDGAHWVGGPVVRAEVPGQVPERRPARRSTPTPKSATRAATELRERICPCMLDCRAQQLEWSSDLHPSADRDRAAYLVREQVHQVALRGLVEFGK